MPMDGKTLLAVGKPLNTVTEEFVLGSPTSQCNDSREKMTGRPLAPYVVLALGIILLGAGLWMMALIVFLAYIILNAVSFEKPLKESILLPSELVSTSLEDKAGYDARF